MWQHDKWGLFDLLVVFGNEFILDFASFFALIVIVRSLIILENFVWNKKTGKKTVLKIPCRLQQQNNCFYVKIINPEKKIWQFCCEKFLLFNLNYVNDKSRYSVFFGFLFELEQVTLIYFCSPKLTSLNSEVFSIFYIFNLTLWIFFRGIKSLAKHFV